MSEVPQGLQQGLFSRPGGVPARAGSARPKAAQAGGTRMWRRHSRPRDARIPARRRQGADVVLKKLLKRAIRPVITPLWRRLWARIEGRVHPLESRIQEMEAGFAPLAARIGALEARLAPLETGWREHLPAFLNAVSTVGAFGHELARTKRDLQEALRRSIIENEGRTARPEAESGHSQGVPNGRSAVIRGGMPAKIVNGLHAGPGLGIANGLPRIRSPEKLAEASVSGLRLNLGCGRVPIERYVNIDSQDLPGVDIVASADNLPLPAGSVQEIFSVHVLQYFPQEELRRLLLPYWLDLLSGRGKFRAIVPDGEAMVARMADGTYGFDDFRAAIFDGRACDGYTHLNLFTPRSLAALLDEAGFAEVAVPAKGRCNGKSFEFEIVGFKP